MYFSSNLCPLYFQKSGSPWRCFLKNMKSISQFNYYIFRAWERKLHALVNDNTQKAQLYACLWYLMSGQSIEKFEENIEKFVLYWENRESAFMKYFKDTYLDRKGIMTHFFTLHLHIYMHLHTQHREMGTLLSYIRSLWYRYKYASGKICYIYNINNNRVKCVAYKLCNIIQLSQQIEDKP